MTELAYLPGDVGEIGLAYPPDSGGYSPKSVLYELDIGLGIKPIVRFFSSSTLSSRVVVVELGGGC